MLYAISIVCMYVCYVYIKRSINQSINQPFLWISKCGTAMLFVLMALVMI